MGSRIEVDHRRHEVRVILADEVDAWDLAHAFPSTDGFHKDMAKAIAECWSEDAKETW